MAQYMEFMGISGIGKSTTYQFLRKQSRRNPGWISYHDLSRSRGNGGIGAFEFFLRALFKPATLPRLAFDWDRLDNFFNSHPELIERFWQSFPGNKNKQGRDLRFRVVQYILGIMEKMQTIREESTDNLCIVDEGLIHNLKYFTTATNEMEFKAQVRELLSLIQLPTAVVLFSGNVETVVKRTLERGNLKPGDQHLSLHELREARENSLREKQMIADELREKNIPVLHLDSGQSVLENSLKIESFIGSICREDKFSKNLTPEILNS